MSQYSEMKHRVSFIEESEAVSPNGFKSSSWNQVKDVWSGIRSYKKSRMISNENILHENTVVFTVRYQELSNKWRIVFNGVTYEILSIQDPTFEKRFYEISAKEVK